MQETTIEYRLEAKDNVSAVLESVKNKIDSMKRTLSQTGWGEENLFSIKTALGSLFTSEESEKFTRTVSRGLAKINAGMAVFAASSIKSFAEFDASFQRMSATVSSKGQSISNAIKALQEVSSRGLITKQATAESIQNLVSFGYSVDEARQMIEAMTESAAANRREGLSVSEAVELATEGIARNSTQKAKAAGNTQTASQAEAEYAASLGKTASELTDAEKRQAIMNSTLAAGEQYTGSAAQYQTTFAGSVEMLKNSFDDLKTSFGGVFQALAPYIQGIAKFITENRQAIVTTVAFIGVFAGSAGLLFTLWRAASAVITFVKTLATISSVAKIATLGVLGIAAALATFAAMAAATSQLDGLMNDLGNTVTGTAEDSEAAADSFDNLGSSIGGVGGSARDLSKELEKLRRQYLDDLKQIEIRHNDTIKNLTKQIQEANVDYRRAIDERNAEFAVSQAKEEKKHQEKVDDIMTQIAFLQRYNNDYNKQKLANLEFALAKENALYQKQTQAAKEELELQNENDRQAYETKRAELQAELDEELAFMNKHREDLKEVRNWILLDEIESLKQRYEEQKKSYSEQAIGAGIGGANVGSNFISGVEAETNKYDWSGLGGKIGDSLGGGIGESAKAAVANFLSNAWKVIKAFADAIKEGFENLFAGNFDYWKGGLSVRSDEYWKKRLADGGAKGWALGGYTGPGSPDEVAGIVHKGEYVLPQELVDQTTGTPKALGGTYNIYVNGTFATSAAERRKVADQIVAAINQNNKSRLETAWQ